MIKVGSRELEFGSRKLKFSYGAKFQLSGTKCYLPGAKCSLNLAPKLRLLHFEITIGLSFKFRAFARTAPKPYEKP